jgi:hypothetical protein
VQNLEDPTLTVMVLNLECVPSEAISSPESTFYIRRLPIVMAMGEALIPEPKTPRDWSSSNPNGDETTLWFLMHTGFHLHSPYEPIFGNRAHYEDTKLLGKVLDLKPHLPEEIRIKIRSSTQEDPEPPLRSLIDTRHARDSSAVIQCLVHLNDDELANTHAALFALFGDEDFALRQWKPSKPASRRDVSRIVEHLNDLPGTVAFLLNQPKSDQELDLALLYMIHTDNVMLPILEQGEMSRLTTERLDRVARHLPFSQLKKEIEIFLDPRKAFPPSLPPWFKQLPLFDLSSERLINTSIPHALLQQDTALVFSLTKNLSDVDKERLMDGLPETGTLSFMFFPWEKETDGGPSDMLRLMKMVDNARKENHSVDETLIFIDRQSSVDGNVIICTKR